VDSSQFLSFVRSPKFLFSSLGCAARGVRSCASIIMLLSDRQLCADACEWISSYTRYKGQREPEFQEFGRKVCDSVRSNCDVPDFGCNMRLSKNVLQNSVDLSKNLAWISLSDAFISAGGLCPAFQGARRQGDF
jgi:hypothetical protein